MIRFALWLLITLVTLAIVGAYFEYVVSRECDFGIVCVTSFTVPMIVIGYLYYSIKQLTKFLKIKNK